MENQAKAQETRQGQLHRQTCSRERKKHSSPHVPSPVDPPAMALYHRHTAKTTELSKQLLVVPADFWTASTSANWALVEQCLHRGVARAGRSEDLCVTSRTAFTVGCYFLRKEGHKHMCLDAFQVLCVFLINIG